VRIAQVAPPWLAVPPKGYGGIEWIVALLADGLAEAGHDVTLFATGDSVTKAALRYVFDEAPGSEAINSPGPDAAHALEALRNPAEFDVYHVHAPFAELVGAVMAGVPVVHTLHGEFSPVWREIYSRIADRVWYVAISESQRAQMPELRYAGVVYNGIDLDRYPLRTEKEDFVLFLGRTAPEKGVRRAVETARLTGDRLVLAVKVAAEHEEAEWAAVEPMLPENAEVLGEVTHEEKVELLQRAKAVLFPIDWEEPFGLVMAEAMACGTPVIATPRGAAPEVVEDGRTGWIVSVAGYPEEAAARLQRLEEIDPHACREHVRAHFSKETMVAGYERVYELAVGKEDT
jgi:glycosyltransferase involved in cell wall biosynthesis